MGRLEKIPAKPKLPLPQSATRERAPRWLHFAVIAVVCCALAFGLWVGQWRWGQFLDNAALDVDFSLRGSYDPQLVAGGLPQSKDIIIIDLQHDVPRPLLAKLIDKLHLARAVGLDLMFSDRENELSHDERVYYEGDLKRWKHEDAILATSIRRAGNVVLGLWPERDGGVDKAHPGAVLDGTKWSRPPKSLESAARKLAHLLVLPDPQDGLIRRVRLYESVDGLGTPSFALAVAHLGHLSKAGQAWVQKTANGSSPMVIDYLGPRGCFEYERLVLERALTQYEPEDFRDKIVLVGQTDYRSKDTFPTPFGDMPGLIIHANTIATLLSDSGPPQPMPGLLIFGFSLAMTLFLTAVLLRYRLLLGLPVALLLMPLVVLFGALFFDQAGFILPVSVPIVAIMGTYNGVALYENSRFRHLLGRLVGQSMVSQLLDTLANPHLGGKVETATAFFCDLRGYSTLSQNLPPEKVIPLLNLYTSVLVRAVRPFGGRPIDYLGDGVFVLFESAPNKSVPNKKDHALRAVRAALAAQEALNLQFRELQKAAKIHAELSDIVEARLVAGIALHTGPMVIGLVGDEDHLKPGAVGDAVNVAARLQGLTEICGYSVLLSRSTLDDCKGAIEAVYCGEHQLKGREGLVEVFGVGEPLQRGEPLRKEKPPEIEPNLKPIKNGVG